MRFIAFHFIFFISLSARTIAATTSSSSKSEIHSLTSTHSDSSLATAASSSASPTIAFSTNSSVHSINATSHSHHFIQTNKVGNFPTTTGSIASGFSDRPHPHSSNDADPGQKPLFIFLEVLGGVVAFGLLIGLLRCLISYQRTPHRDRVAAFIHRHEIQREMDEIRERQVRLNRSSLAEPAPPPYHPPPPSYPQGNDNEVSTPLILSDPLSPDARDGTSTSVNMEHQSSRSTLPNG